MEHQSVIAKVLLDLASFYGQDLTLRQVEMYVEVLSKFPLEQVSAASKAYVRDPKNTKFPIPPHSMIAKMYPEPDAKHVAIEIARKIDRAVSRHGYVWEGGFTRIDGPGHYWRAVDSNGDIQLFGSFKEAVICELGEVGWHAICSRGGWQSVRESANTMQEGQFIAQLRDQVQASYSLKLQGIDVAKIELPGRRDDELTQLSNIKQFITTRDFPCEPK